MKKTFSLVSSLPALVGFLFLVSALPAHAAGIIGNIDCPAGTYCAAGSEGQGLFLFLGNLFKLVATIAGIYLIFQIISAGYQYISASGDAKKVEAATSKITQAALGMVIVASAFVLAGLIQRFTGIHIIDPIIYGPNN